MHLVQIGIQDSKILVLRLDEFKSHRDLECGCVHGDFKLEFTFDQPFKNYSLISCALQWKPYLKHLKDAGRKVYKLNKDKYCFPKIKITRKKNKNTISRKDQILRTKELLDAR